MKCHLFYFFIGVAIVFFSCNRLPHEVQQVLDKPGVNKKELEKVIDHYRKTNDKDKLKAVYFLIANLTHHYHYEGKGVENYKMLFSHITLLPKERKRYLERIWDSLVQQYVASFPGPVKPIDDMLVMKADYLINHIDNAFKTWQYPWARSLDFDAFCEYILPYKLVNEQADTWSSAVQKEFGWLTDSMVNSNDPYKACLLINRKLKEQFEITAFPAMWDVNYSELKAIACGKCYHATQYGAYVMRAMGVPVTMDFTLFWGNMNGGHEWDALIYNGKPIPFVAAESDPGRTKVDLTFQRKRAKIFRHTYSLQKGSLAFMAEGTNEEIPSYYKNYFIADVTEDYIPVTTIKVKLDSEMYDHKFAYLCVFNWQKWTPVFWSEIHSSGDVTFKDMGRGIVYIPMYYDMQELVPAGTPFILNNNGSIESIMSDPAKKMKIVVKSKGPQGPQIEKEKEYELFYWDKAWVSLGKKKALTDSLICDNVPANSLFWVHSAEKATRERIFTYKNNNQVWW